MSFSASAGSKDLRIWLSHLSMSPLRPDLGADFSSGLLLAALGLNVSVVVIFGFFV